MLGPRPTFLYASSYRCCKNTSASIVLTTITPPLSYTLSRCLLLKKNMSESLSQMWNATARRNLTVEKQACSYFPSKCRFMDHIGVMHTSIWAMDAFHTLPRGSTIAKTCLQTCTFFRALKLLSTRGHFSKKLLGHAGESRRPHWSIECQLGAIDCHGYHLLVLGLKCPFTACLYFVSNGVWGSQVQSSPASINSQVFLSSPWGGHL
jgi:hypothetical protein